MNFKLLAVIPLYNKEKYVKRAVDSVLDQQFACDLLVIDDGSTDDSLAIVKSINSEYLFITTQTNKGVSATRNRGINYALKENYDFVAFLDADDYWLPNHIQNLYTLAQANPAASVLSTNYYYSLKPQQYTTTKYSYSLPKTDVLEHFFTHNFLDVILHSSNLCIKLNETMPVLYNETLTHSEDVDYNIRVGISKKIAFSKKVSVVVDRSAQGRSDKVASIHRTYFQLDQYEQYSKTIPGLKKFLDLNRYATTIELLLLGDTKKAAAFRENIEVSSLSRKQRSLLKLSAAQLKTLKKIHDYIQGLGLRWRTGS